MRIVAVAGGTGSVGQTIVEALVAYDKHKVVVLTRKVSHLPHPTEAEPKGSYHSDTSSASEGTHPIQ
jgi:uncharacterized protein YbjT (DUF2867 family)